VTRTILADDHRLFCEGLEKVLKESGKFEVCGKFYNGQSLLENYRSLNAHLLVIDVEMPLMNGFDTIKRIRINNPDLNIVVLSMHEDAVFINEAYVLGANGFLNKSLDSSELIKSLVDICDGAKIFPFANKGEPKLESPFSEREQEILQHIATGKTSEQIAAKLNISHLTVKAHRRNMMRKLKVNNSAELITKALEMGALLMK